MRRRRLLSVLLLLISGFGGFLLAAAKPVSEHLWSPRWEHVNRTCRARDCNETISLEQLRYIESNMNRSADPCESFYNYSCDMWRHQHPNGTTMMMEGYDQLTAHYVKLFENWILQRDAEENKAGMEWKIKGLLVQSPNDESDHQSIWYSREDVILQKMLKYYGTCKAKKNAGVPSLVAYFEASKSSMNWNLSGYDWVETIAGLGQFGYSAPFLNMKVVQKNVSVHRVVICPHEWESRIELNSEMYEILSDFTNQTKETLQQRFNALEDELESLNCQYCEQTPEEASAEAECDCFSSGPITFANLTARLPAINWQRYLSPQLGRHLRPNDIVEIANLELIDSQLEYVNQIETELNFLYTLARFLNFVEQQRQKFLKHSTIELNCIHHMRKVFNMPMNYLYERAVYSSVRPQSQRIIEEVFDEVKHQFELMIQQNKMAFSDLIREKMLKKLRHITINVGNLPKQVPNQFYSDYIDPYHFEDDFSVNHLHALRVFYKYFNALMDVSEDDLEHVWHSFELHQPFFPDSLDASPYYNARTNRIVITFAYLQRPFFDASFWPALIYGDLASTLGHELIHAFDTEFLKFDEHGNPSAQPLEGMFFNENFRRNFVCLQKGTLFERERMADVSGARLALNTFLSLDPKALESNGELYFLQFSQFFCGALNQGDANHEADSLRLDYVLGVLPEFSSVFNCPLGSRMNPHEKCEMYT